MERVHRASPTTGPPLPPAPLYFPLRHGRYDVAPGLTKLGSRDFGGGAADALPADAITTYTITAEDAAGPFTPDIPVDMVEKSKLKSLGYKNLLEALGERFHVSPTLLKRLNPTAKFAAGEEIKVPNVLDTVQPVGPPRGRQSDA